MWKREERKADGGGWGKKRRTRAELEILRRSRSEGKKAAAGPGTLGRDSTRTDGSADAAGPANESRKVGLGLRRLVVLAASTAVGGKWLLARSFLEVPPSPASKFLPIQVVQRG